MTRIAMTAVLLAVVAACSGASVAAQADIRPWGVLEIEMTAERELASPYCDGLPDAGPGYVTVTFRGEGGEAQGSQVTISGFWDGGRTWRARFAPPAPGARSYRSKSRDPGPDGKTGRFQCVAWTAAEKEANPTRRGFVRVCRTGPRPGRHFEYADGTPMLWLGDTWWNWTKRGIPFERFQKLADNRAAKGFNVGTARGSEVGAARRRPDHPARSPGQHERSTA